MKRLRRFFSTSLLGGLIVVLPIAIFAIVINWLFEVIIGLVNPLTPLIFPNATPNLGLDVLVVLIILGLCFAIGVMVRTRFGQFIHSELEQRILNVAPGYSLIKETINQFMGRSKPPFSSVALVQIFESDTLMTAFVTDEHPDGSYTVFIPTGPNPTSGNIYHVRRERVTIVNVPVETALRSVIACGAGSGPLVMQHLASQRGLHEDTRILFNPKPRG